MLINFIINGWGRVDGRTDRKQENTMPSAVEMGRSLANAKVQPNFGQLLYARIKQRLLLVSALSLPKHLASA